MYNFEESRFNMKKIAIINGPNLNLLGKREPEIYGNVTFESFLETQTKSFDQMEILYFQSNIEGELIDYIQKADVKVDGILLNAGGYTHTSVAIADAVAAIRIPVIEVHISQPMAREKERHNSLLSKYCKGSISGLGMESYRLALDYFNTI